MKEVIKLIYHVENNELYVRTLLMNNEVSNIKIDSIENILHKAKMFDEEYQELLKQNNLMMYISKSYEQLESNWNELKKHIDKEKDRLVRETSIIYYDSLDKARLVNEDIYNELKNISDKMQEFERGKE